MSKPTLLQLREKHGINTVILAEAAGVRPDIVYAMLVGRPVEKEDVEKILSGIRKLTGVAYGADDIDAAIRSE